MTSVALRHAARSRTRLLLLATLGLAVLAHGCAVFGTFVFDDIHSIAANWHLQDTAHWWRWLSDPTAFSDNGAMFRPMVLLSLGLTFAIDDAPWLFKLSNVLLHAGVCGLAFGWLRGLGLRSLGAFSVVALLAVHPLVSECTNLVSARSELLLWVGLLVGLRAHLWWCRGGPAVPAVGLALLGAAIACGSKETGVVLPALMVAQSLFVRRARGAGRVSSGARSVIQRAAVTIVPVGLLVLGYLALRQELLGVATVSFEGRTTDDPLAGHGRSFVTQFATMGLLLPRALVLMVFPVGLSIDPAVDFRHSFDGLVLVGWGSVLALLLMGLLPGRGAALRRLALAVAGAAALPWIVIPLNMPLAEHRLYGPLLALLVAVQPWLPNVARRPRATIALLLLGVVLSNARALEFRSETALWQAELEDAPTWRAWWGLGAAHLRAGDTVAAVEPLARAYDGNDRHGTLLRHFAEALTRLPADAARPWRALAVTDRYVTARPDDPYARTLSAQAHLQVGRATDEPQWFEEAERLALSCLDIAEPKGLVFRLAAAARTGLDDHAGALQHLDRSLALGRDHYLVRLARAEALRALDRHHEARTELLRAAQQNPMEPAVLHALRASPPR